MSKELDKIKDKILKLTAQYTRERLSQETFVEYISKVPVTGKVINDDDIVSLVDSSLEGWLTSGQYTEKFEKAISKFLGTRHTLFVNSGSSANLLAMSALKEFYELKDGDEIITSAVGFPTTINPIIQNNLKPVLIDAEIATLNINADLIESSISERTKGIVIAHTLGNPFDLDKILKLCEKYNLFLMEDNCDAFGSKYNNQLTGTFGDVSTLSFYPAHHITTGEGGAVTTSNPKLKKIMESIRDWGRDCYCPPGVDNTCKKRFDWQLGGLPHGYDHKYIYSHIGYNLKASDMQAALGVTQIDKLNSFITKRKENYEYLYSKFIELEEFELIEKSDKSDPSWFGFPLLIKDLKKVNRRDLLKHLDNDGIGTRLLFGGNLTLQPAYENVEFIVNDELLVSNEIMNRSFWVGVYPGLTNQMLDHIVSSVKNFLEKIN
ncbi:lipopolysaccharide biosynthesis protein RfbH [Acidimicrobiaceae bacterium]|nr:lipopolysaccharide biosynthesis protein RfbH [Acidimicrobiaceae bacterium]